MARDLDHIRNCNLPREVFVAEGYVSYTWITRQTTADEQVRFAILQLSYCARLVGPTCFALRTKTKP